MKLLCQILIKNKVKNHFFWFADVESAPIINVNFFFFMFNSRLLNWSDSSKHCYVKKIIFVISQVPEHQMADWGQGSWFKSRVEKVLAQKLGVQWRTAGRLHRCSSPPRSGFSSIWPHLTLTPIYLYTILKHLSTSFTTSPNCC